jgi:hypothetical protein
MASTLEPTRSRPWYREPWPWFLISLPAAAVIAGVITVWIAYRSADGLVVGDYYKAGLAINQTLARDERARDLGLSAAIFISGPTIGLDLAGRLDSFPSSLRVLVAHPTRQGADQTLELMHTGSGNYRGALEPLSDGKWQLQIEDPQASWRLNGALHTPMTETVMLRYVDAAE